MKKSMLTLLLVVVAFVTLQANPEPAKSANPEPSVEQITSTYTLSGNVQDSHSNETLAGVSLIINGQKVYSDFDGNFSFTNVCEGNCELKISYISYQDKIVKIDVTNNERMQIYLQQR